MGAFRHNSTALPPREMAMNGRAPRASTVTGEWWRARVKAPAAGAWAEILILLAGAMLTALFLLRLLSIYDNSFVHPDF